MALDHKALCHFYIRPIVWKYGTYGTCNNAVPIASGFPPTAAASLAADKLSQSHADFLCIWCQMSERFLFFTDGIFNTTLLLRDLLPQALAESPSLSPCLLT